MVRERNAIGKSWKKRVEASTSDGIDAAILQIQNKLHAEGLETGFGLSVSIVGDGSN